MPYAATFDNGVHHRESTYFISALLLSLALHTLALIALNPLNFNTAKPVTMLDVALAPPPKPPAPPPEPPKPKDPPPKPTQAPKRVPVEQIKTVTPLPETFTPEPPPRVEPVPPPVISVPQKATVEPPAFTAPPPPPDPPKTVPTVDMDAARGIYGAQLSREFARHKQYPRLAQMRGWQGTVQVQVHIDAGGAVISSSINQSSGHEVLDKQALEMVKKASPLPQPPEALRDRELTMLVPIVFRLE